jgi:hypothetical protein
VPPQFILQALDDNGDGVEDDGAFDVLTARACGAVDAICSSLFTVPFASPFPVLIGQAAQTFAAKLLYQRRGIESDKNPFTKEAKDVTDKLTRICRKDEPVPADFPTSSPSVTAITDRAKTVSTGGFLCA